MTWGCCEIPRHNKRSINVGYYYEYSSCFICNTFFFFLKIPLGIVLLQQYWGSIYNYFLDPPMILLDNHDRAVA